MNKVWLTGRWTKDIDLRFAAGTGKGVAKSTLAVDRRGKEKETDFLNVVMFGKVAENVANYSGKGRLVAVSGSIQTGSYTAQDGTKKYTTEIIADEVQFLDKVQKNNEDCPQDEFKEIENMDECPF